MGSAGQGRAWGSRKVAGSVLDGTSRDVQEVDCWRQERSSM